MTDNTFFHTHCAVTATVISEVRHTFNRLFVASAVALTLTIGYAVNASAAPKWAEGRVLLQTKAGLSDAELDKILKAHNGKAIGHIRQINLHIIEVPPQAEEAVARALAHNPNIKFAELDLLVEAGQIPNDPGYTNAWHLPKIQAPTAWDSSQGAGVTVAILDSGVDATHPDLAGQLVAGWNSADNTTNTSDINGHGTWVAGTAGAATNNSIGVASVAGGARIMPIRVTNFSDGSAYFSAIANGLTWAADHGAQVANISFDMLTTSSSVSSAAQYMNSKGGVVVVAAGNTGTDRGYSDNLYMISVSATDSSDVKASWSSFGYYVDVAAPGVSIWTTTQGGGYNAVNGTSFASPVTAGVIALMKAANPSLSPATLERVLESTATDLGSAGWDTYYGYGRVNAAAAVQTAMQTQDSDSQAPSVSITSPSSGSTVAGVTAVNVSATDNVGVTRIDLYANGALIASDVTSPFGFSWDTTAQTDGSATLVAYGYDAVGNQGISTALSVTVKNTAENTADTLAPSVQITQPVDGARVTGTIVSIRVNASDNVAVTKITVVVDGKTLCTSNNATLSCNWNIKKIAAGAHTISATAEDAANNKTTTLIQVTK